MVTLHKPVATPAVDGALAGQGGPHRLFGRRTLITVLVSIALLALVGGAAVTAIIRTRQGATPMVATSGNAAGTTDWRARTAPGVGDREYLPGDEFVATDRTVQPVRAGTEPGFLEYLDGEQSTSTLSAIGIANNATAFCPGDCQLGLPGETDEGLPGTLPAIPAAGVGDIEQLPGDMDSILSPPPAAQDEPAPLFGPQP